MPGQVAGLGQTPQFWNGRAGLSGAGLRIGVARYSYYILVQKRIGIYVLRITYHGPGPKLGVRDLNTQYFDLCIPRLPWDNTQL